jgi:hypothetical protein
MPVAAVPAMDPEEAAALEEQANRAMLQQQEEDMRQQLSQTRCEHTCARNGRTGVVLFLCCSSGAAFGTDSMIVLSKEYLVQPPVHIGVLMLCLQWPQEG